jgi:hypothetical protein
MTTHDEQALLEQAARLPKQVSPGRDLWPDIETAIAHETAQAPARIGLSRWSATAALAASLLLALFIGYEVGRDTPEQPPIGAQPVNLVEAAGLLETRRTMAAEIEAGLYRLPPDARSVVVENLAAISDALDEIDAVLAEAPPTGLDRQVLMAMYVDQLALLGSVRHLVLHSNQEILL